jgi:DNA-directed RNA polymerase specialized sigma24 family protein
MATREEDREFLRYRESGDPQAMARVFDLTASRLLLLAVHLVRDASQAEDLVQTTFLQAIQDADRV